ncbi:LOW QUALITY PROTEIN: hypothetical protein ACHAXS_000568 [Conticribra weissflogii]
MLVVDDFGIKYVNKKLLLNTLKHNNYKVEINWTGGLYCGLTIDWSYKDRHVDISMTGYINKQLQKYEHIQNQPRSMEMMTMILSQKQCFRIIKDMKT